MPSLVRLLAVALLVGTALVALGLAVNALNIAFMAGAGWRMAALFRGATARCRSCST